MVAERKTLIIGWREPVSLPELGIGRVIAKIDTGARTSALHAERIRHFDKDGVPWVRFHVPHAGLEEAVDCDARVVDSREIRNTSGIPEERVVVETMLRLGGRRWRIELSLADRMAMAFPLILGRTAIRGRRIVVNPGRSLLTDLTRKDRP
jgi:hypothetical protein